LARLKAGCFARAGHEVIGVDAVRTRVDFINQGVRIPKSVSEEGTYDVIRW